jgi:hypothetical protein
MRLAAAFFVILTSGLLAKHLKIQNAENSVVRAAGTKKIEIVRAVSCTSQIASFNMFRSMCRFHFSMCVRDLLFHFVAAGFTRSYNFEFALRKNFVEKN